MGLAFFTSKKKFFLNKMQHKACDEQSSASCAQNIHVHVQRAQQLLLLEVKQV